ncbi:zona pellucida protein AX 1 [Engraulis encrasicolus]|uniref:zona pellucida protein AX 1 n=1 Tax=Engraulis encrasicolus TaxID=184585 RepID=UPI002FD44423
MARVLHLLPWLLMVTVMTSGQGRYKHIKGLRSQCLGNIMRVTLDKSLAIGNRLEVDVLNGSSYMAVSPAMASQCGYSMHSDPWGNTRLYSTAMACHVENRDDEVFSGGLRLRLYGEQGTDEDAHEVSKTCRYDQWADREIICQRNFMEVSVNRLPPPIEEGKDVMMGAKTGDDQLTGAGQEPVTSASNIWRMVFFTPKEKSMSLSDAQRAGYGVGTSPTRLFFRTPYNNSETYSENVAGVQMRVVKVTTYFKDMWSVTMLDTAAACPTGGTQFSEQSITWFLPRHIYPLLAGHSSDTLEVYMGIAAERLSDQEMSSRGYIMAVTDSHITVQLPVGGPDGFYKSHAPGYEYHITYSIEPMLEVLWREEDQLTRYKVLYPITTPAMPRPPHLWDDTVAEERIFDLTLGTFLHDVQLVNLTFTTGVMNIEEANSRGFNVQEHRFPNASKTFTLQVPFDDPVVAKSHFDRDSTTYTLPLTFGFMILPELTPFSHSVVLDASLQDVVFPVVTGTCDDEAYYVTVAYGSQGNKLKTVVGKRELTSELAKEYGVRDNATHMTMRVPFLSPDSVFTFVIPFAAGGRLDMKLLEPTNLWSLNDFSLGCTFPMPLTECHANGTMTALALKVESVPDLVLEQLTLRDTSCRPLFTNDRFASFAFPVNSCGTTRRFVNGMVVYENEISVAGGNQKQIIPLAQKKSGKKAQPPYRLTISCYYEDYDFKMLAFVPSARQFSRTPIHGMGEMKMQMKLATDASYSSFYMAEDFPVVEYLKQPLYFEVELIGSEDPELVVFLENCWATLGRDRLSTPRWDLIVDGCPNNDDSYTTTVLPPAAGLQNPSHVKRFEMIMFAFMQNDTVVKDQIFVHCDAAICDNNRQTSGLCYRDCSSYPGPMRGPTRPDGKSKGQSGVQLPSWSKKQQLSSGWISMSR